MPQPSSLLPTAEAVLAGFSRRRFLQATGVAGALGVLAACGTSDGGSAAGSSAAGGTGFPAKVEHRFGTAVIDADPQRIVCIGYTDADFVLALGGVPVGLTQWIPEWKRGVGTWAESRLGDATPELFTPPWDFEKVASLGPDLILNIGSDGAEADYKKLNDIAPTIEPPAEFGAYGVPWSVMAVMIGTAMGKQAESEKLVADTTAMIATSAGDNPSFAGQTLSIVTHYNNGTVGVYHTSDTRMRLIADLGLTATDYVKGLGEDDFFSDVSAEQVDKLDADVVLAFGDPGETETDLFAKIPGLETFTATKNGALIVISDLEPAMAFSASTTLSIPLALQTVVPPLQKATAG